MKGATGDGTGNESARLSVSLARGLAVLSAFGNRPTLGISEVAAMLGMSNPTVHRYVRTLEELGYLCQDAETRRYRLGPRMSELGLDRIDSLTIREAAAPTLKRLAEVSGRAVSLSVLDGVDVVLVDGIGAGGSKRDPHVGSRLPAYCTSAGKVLLAFLAPDDAAARLRRIEFWKRGPNTPSGPTLLAEFDHIRSAGYGVSNEELDYKLRSIAAPVRSSTGMVVAAVSVTEHRSRAQATEFVSRHAESVVAAGAEISRQLGLRPGRPIGRSRRRS